MLRLNDILERVQSYHKNADLDLIKKAYVFSAQAHQGQVRKSGEPYLVHPLEVSGLLADMRLDEYAICAGILHDTVEDTQATKEDIEALFGKQVADIVDGVTKLSTIPYTTSFEKSAENFRRMLVAMAQDIRVILVKLADRLHNMRTLEFMKPEKQELIAIETLEIYAPLANRLGIHWVKAALEDLCLRYVHPTDFKYLEEKLAASAKARQSYLDDFQDHLTACLTPNLQCQIKGRVKHLYSIWRKLKSQGIEFEEVNDILAFRVITETVGQCYEALGWCHAAWRPVPGRFKDHIAMPKPNGYRSLHTTVIGPEHQRVEIQIRTAEMNEIAENGVAAHWQYKEGRPAGNKGEQYAWMRQLLEWQQELTDPSEFIQTVKVDLFGDEVYVFTPKGEVKELRKGATPVDFAYLIHSEVGDHCTGAKVNGRLVPLRYRLKNGDTVEIMTSSDQRPNKDWLGFVKTGRARACINAYLRREQRKRAAELGLEMLEREAKRYGVSAQRVLKLDAADSAKEKPKHRVGKSDLLASIGYGKVKAVDVLRRLLPDKVIEKGPTGDDVQKSRLGQLIDAVARKSRSGVTVHGIDEMLVRFAKCCAPVPGEPIVGFVTRGRGITVHSVNCAKSIELDPERRLPVSWDLKVPAPRSVMVRIVTDNQPGMLASMSQAFTGAGINILSADCRSRKDERAINTFMVSVQNAMQLRGVLRSIEGLKGVYRVERVRA
jgi:GTP diphosphokinase / guanosine-3',5'-bis(diphosphate) 3'-diphosphatase